MTEKISAVANDDIDKLLKSLNLLDELESNQLYCSICNEPLTLITIGCIYPYEQEINICCDKLICLQKAIDKVTPLRHLEIKEDEAE